ncbi:MAG: hypothetical protein J0M29_21750 [Chitinophagales bacterium]|nr:hypothetical protein [Chitinophagales bacterium]
MTVCKEVIISQLARKGSGKYENSPARILTQVYEKSGVLIAEFDPNLGFSMEDLLSFAQFYFQKIGLFTDWMAANQRAF